MLRPIVYFDQACTHQQQKLFICPACGKITQISVDSPMNINLSELEFNKTNVTIDIDTEAIVIIDALNSNVCNPICKHCDVRMSICDPDNAQLAQVLAALGARDIEIVAGKTLYMGRFFSESFYRIIFALYINNIYNTMIHRALIEGIMNKDVSLNVYDSYGMEGIGYYVEIIPSDSRMHNREDFVTFCNDLKDRLIKYL